MVPFLRLGSLAPLFNTVRLVALMLSGLLFFTAYKLLKESP